MFHVFQQLSNICNVGFYCVFRDIAVLSFITARYVGESIFCLQITLAWGIWGSSAASPLVLFIYTIKMWEENRAIISFTAADKKFLFVLPWKDGKKKDWLEPPTPPPVETNGKSNMPPFTWKFLREAEFRDDLLQLFSHICSLSVSFHVF